MKIKSIRNLKNLKGRRVFLRVDFNVPIKKGKILDEYKIMAQLSTIRFLLKNKCRIILATHLGRPEGGRIEKDFSVKPIAERVGGLSRKKIKILNSCADFETGTAISKMEEGEIVMLENIRFEKGEKKNDRKLARNLAKLADIYVLDAFAASHRKHASVSAIQKYLPSYAGLLLEKEIENLNKILNPEGPLVVVIGGVKTETKIPLIKKLYKKSFRILIGGAIANNFLAAHHIPTGKSLIDPRGVKIAAKFKKNKILLPVDVVVSNDRQKDRLIVKNLSEIGKSDYIFDIGPKTIRLYAGFIKKARTIIWNGPMGMFEIDKYKHGTLALAQVIASRSSGRAFGAVGGGETIEALKMISMMQYIDWVSTGGGAMLSFLSGERMPGLVKILK